MTLAVPKSGGVSVPTQCNAAPKASSAGQWPPAGVEVDFRLLPKWFVGALSHARSQLTVLTVARPTRFDITNKTILRMISCLLDVAPTHTLFQGNYPHDSTARHFFYASPIIPLYSCPPNRFICISRSYPDNSMLSLIEHDLDP